MEAGKFDQRVTFERIAVTQDVEGSTVETWTTLFTRWAQVNITNATETFKNDQDFGTRSGFIIIRRDPETQTLNIHDRFLHDSIYWEILGIINVQERDELLEIAIRNYAT